MSATIDERVVTLKFNNGQFELGIKKTLDSLSALKNGLNLDGAKKGLDELDKAGRNFNMGNMGATIESVNAKFLALATIAVTALASITKKAIDTGLQLTKSLTIDPMKMGLQEYETNLNAIQTILANTQSKGTNLDQVNAALQELNEYSDQTIYNFSEMARNIGTFTAAGVDLDKSTAAIKGIANLAAVSGSNSQQASTAMYQLSQALAAGKVSLMDWNSVVNAGMGGEVFQNALKETARAHGVAVDDIIAKQGSFRDSLQEGWITSEILTETLSKFTGDLNAEQLKSMGYTDEQIQKIMQLGQTAKDAATKVKTFTQLQDTLKESAQSGWSQTWQIIFGDFEEAKELWTGVNNVLGGMITNSANARNEMLQTWKDLGGRTAAIEAVKNVFNALMPILDEVKQAFREFFPPMTGERLYELTERIRQFTETLKPSPETLDKIGRAFSGVFALIQIGVNVVKGIISVFKNLLNQADGTGSSILDMAAKIGDWLVNLNRAIIDGKVFENFFGDLNNAINKTIGFVKKFIDFIKELFTATQDVATSGAEGVFDRIGARLEPLGRIGETIVRIFTSLGPAFQKVWEIVRPIAEKVSQFFLDLGQNISESIQNMNFEQLLDTVNTGLLAGLVLIIKKFLSGGINIDPSGGLIDSIKGSFEGLTGVLGAMQAQLKSSALLKIAGAVALLTASVVALSLIDSAKLMSALSALTVMFLQLAGTMALVDRIVASKGFLKLPAVAGAMILLSTAILILSAAVRTMSDLSWEELGKGLSGVLALLGMVAGAAKLLEGAGPRLIAAGAGLILVATAVRILASAVEAFSGMSWAEMAQGLTGVAATLAALALFTKLADAGKGAVAQGAGLILLSVALKILANVVSEFGNMDLGVLTQGLLAMAGALVIIAGAMHLIPGNILVTAAGLVVVAGALSILSGVLKVMGGMSWEELGRGLAGLAGSLIILAGAMLLMQGAIGGAIAIAIAAASLALLTPSLIALSGLSWAELGMGMAALAATFLVLGLAALALTPVLPSLLLLGAAVTLIGVGIAAAGIGVLAFAAGITALSVAVGAGGVAIVAFVGSLIGLIPTALAAVADGIVQFAIIIGNSGPVFVQAISTLLISIAQAIMAAAPVVVEALVSVIMLLIDAIAKLIPYFVTKGLEMITGILNGIAKALPGIIRAATDVVVNFINGIAAAIPRIIEAAINLIITFVEGLAQGIRRNTDRMNAAGRDLADAIVDGAVKGISSGVSTAVNAVKKLATGMLNAAKNVLGINSPSKEFEKVGVWSGEGMVVGLDKTSVMVAKAAENVGTTAISTLRDTMSSVSSILPSEVDMSPVIRPVLDLTQVKKDSGKIDGILTPSSISTSSSYSKAATIAADNRAAQQDMAGTQFGAQPAPAPVQFTQNNYSPKALTPAEIYRQTKNQISVAKGGIS